jgi:hypothetical protein
MMYHNKLAAAIKTNGKILREFQDTVYLPFGSEYSVFLKNLNTVRALVHIDIDGTRVSDNGLVVNANSEVELERAINKNLNQGNKFKFIERTSTIEAYRGAKIEDGLIRIEFQFEKVYVARYNDWHNYYFAGSPVNALNTSQVSYTATSSAAVPRGIAPSGVSLNQQSVHPGVPAMDTGITVPGSISDQKFNVVSNFNLEPEKHVMVFKILGETLENSYVRQPVTVKSKPRCQTCGKQNKASAKFCSSCGTSLQIVA